MVYLRLEIETTSPGRRARVSDSLTVHLDAIRAAEIADLPVPGIFVRQFAVQAETFGN